MDDRPSVTEIDRVVYEMDRQKNLKKKDIPMKLIKLYKIFVLQVLNCVITFDLFQWHFHVFCNSLSIRFRGTSSITLKKSGYSLFQ